MRSLQIKINDFKPAHKRKCFFVCVCECRAALFYGSRPYYYFPKYLMAELGLRPRTDIAHRGSMGGDGPCCGAAGHVLIPSIESVSL